MSPILSHSLLNNTFIANADATLFWEDQKILILSDLHLGKSGHFRKEGIAIPQNVLQQDLFRLSHQIQIYNPKKIIIVGDLFHSKSNKEHNLFVRWLKNYEHIDIHLVLGNHDILQNQFYTENQITTHKIYLEIGTFIFTHDMYEVTVSPDKYYFSGHIHPSIAIKGTGRQFVKLPCFYFTKQYAVLPAFGKFTGTYNIVPKKNETVLAIVKNQIIKIQ